MLSLKPKITLKILFSNLVKILYLSNEILPNVGLTFFYLGIFLLPSAFSIAAIFLLISLIIGFLIQDESYFADKWNIPFFIGGLLIIFSSLLNTLNNIQNINPGEVNPLLSNIYLFNWIPFIFPFYGFQPYLSSKKLRRNCALIFISGTFPVIFSILGQTIFNWLGPLKALNGFIVWYLPDTSNFAFTGLFSNPNYLGSWLIIILPFSLATCFRKNINKSSKVILYVFLISISSSIILCGSRSALICMLISIPLFFGLRSLFWLLPLIVIFSVLQFSILVPIFGENFQEIIKVLTPSGIWSIFYDANYLLDISRIEIWKYALNLIKENPLFGSGASSFPTYIMSESGFWKGHSHNLPLELMASYGIPAALFILIPFTLLVGLSFRNILLKKHFFSYENIFDRSWIISIVLLSLMHLVDIQYFDGRISFAGWILLAGIRNIIKEDLQI